MSDLADRIAALSPEQRALFERLLAEEAKAAPRERIPRLARSEGINRLPLSFAQERLWFLDKLEPGSASYNLPVAVRLQGRLIPEALEQSLSGLVRRHEALRTTIATEGDVPRQLIAPPAPVRLELIDLCGVAGESREEDANRCAREEAGRPFDLTRGPLFRAILIRVAREDSILLLVLHHIIADGWSLGILLREMAILYDAHAAQTAASLDDLPLQYADFAAWQAGYMRGERLREQLDYWRERLDGAPAVLELPLDHPRPPLQTARGDLQETLLPPALSEAVKSLGREQGVTLFMTLLAAYQVLLSRYTSQEDIVVGSPIAGRTRAETDGLIGLFVNTLALRTGLAGNPTVRELLERVREVTLGAYSNQEIPFEKLVEELRPERRLSQTPLFQTVLILQNVEMGPRAFGGLSVRPFPVNNGTAKFDLSLVLQETGDTIRAGLTYNADLFEAETARRMLGHYQVILESFVAQPDARISTLPLLAALEQHQLLVEWNATATVYPRELCLHQLFEAQVERTPDAVALACLGSVMTYRELNARANKLARYLRKRGAGPEVLVGIYLDRSLEMMVGLLGILKSGAAYVPLDPAYPAERLLGILEDAQGPLLVTQRSLRGDLRVAGTEFVVLDAEWPVIEGEEGTDLPSTARPDHLAYVIFTSGSTGRPKGVQVTHRSVVNLLWDMQGRLRLGPADVFPALASFAFDMCIPELYLPIAFGACTLIVNREIAVDGSRLLSELRDARATFLHATPTTWNMLLEAGWRRQPELRMIVGAEALPPDLATRLVEVGGRLLNFYGPTETTVWSAVYEFVAKDDPVCVGRPLGNQQIYILDRNMQPLPVGLAGEVFIGGDGVSRGYKNRPDLTVEKFVPDPFGSRPGGRLYRTGDLARWRQDGNLEFVGRVDHQVKLRGFRIELGEIEAALGRHPAVGERAVLVQEVTPGDKRLIAYLVPAQGEAPTTSELRSFLAAKLPDYMVPSHFVLLEAMPKSPNGKLNRRALLTPDLSRPELLGAFVAPRSPMEEAVAQAWAEVLRTDKIGVHDNFFELGGHSLLAIRLMTRLREALFVDLPLRTVFETPTVAGMAEAASRALLAGASADELAVLLDEVGVEVAAGQIRDLH